MNRIQPNLPAIAYKTYQVVAPKSTHFREATCEEVNCNAWRLGWKTVIDETSTLGQMQAHYIRKESKRKYVETKLENQFTEFLFEAGQQCFASHQTRIDRPEIFVITGGDWRGNPLGTEPKFHSRPIDWVDDFANHQDKIQTQLERG